MGYDQIDRYIITELYSAESEMVQRLALIDNMALTEAESPQVLNEALKEVITQYIQKITLSITKAWAAFKGKQVDNKLMELINKNTDKLNSGYQMLGPEGFVPPQIQVWNNLSEKVTIPEFTQANYNGWKDGKYLESSEAFNKQFFPDFVDGDLAPKDVLNKKVFPEEGKGGNTRYPINGDKIGEMVEFLKGYSKNVDTLGKSIDKFNASNKNIQTLLNSLQESTTYMGYSLLSEAPEDNNQQNNTNTQQSTTVDKNAGNKSVPADPNDPKNGDKKNNNTEDRKNIVTYYKACTAIFSAELRTCIKIETRAAKLVKDYINLQGGNEGDNNQQQNNNNQNQENNNGGGNTVIQK